MTKISSEQENYWRGYIDAKVEDLGKTRILYPSVKAQNKYRDELLVKFGLNNL